jgi:hypothetical protein
MAAHRAQLLLALLPTAMSTGFAEVEPELERLTVITNFLCADMIANDKPEF